jgi:uncharacterized protein YndB with AHSA1/START domain
MTQLEYEAFIAAPIEDIYEYAANPRNCVEWYPGTREVEHAPEGLPQVGDEWEESIKIAGMWMRLTWRATEVESPRAWTIEGSAKIHGPLNFLMEGGTATLRHRLDEGEGGTSYRREITFHMSNPILRLANRLVLKRKMNAELQEALQCLKRIVEGRQIARSAQAEDTA